MGTVTGRAPWPLVLLGLSTTSRRTSSQLTPLARPGPEAAAAAVEIVTRVRVIAECHGDHDVRVSV